MPGKLLLGAALACSLLYGQRGGRRGGGGGDEMDMPMRAAPQSKIQVLEDKLKLDKDQKEELQKILSAAAEEAAPLRTQISNARVQLAGLLIENKGGDAVQQAQAAYSGLASQLAAIEAKAFGKLYAILKPHQQSRAPLGFELLAGILEQPGGGRGRGMGNGGGRSR